MLLLDKPLGFSSNQALQKVKWLFQAAKAGHTGTLDPLATGLLPVCFGEATKFAHYLTDADKTYIATIKLGVTTNTGDAEGEVLATHSVNVSPAQFAQACAQFVGEISQIPPMYSALKHEGKALYEYARAGVEIERASRLITIHSIQVNSFEYDVANISVSCSKGTYIRTLAGYWRGSRMRRSFNWLAQNENSQLQHWSGSDIDAVWSDDFRAAPSSINADG